MGRDVLGVETPCNVLCLRNSSKTRPKDHPYQCIKRLGYLSLFAFRGRSLQLEGKGVLTIGFTLTHRRFPDVGDMSLQEGWGYPRPLSRGGSVDGLHNFAMIKYRSCQ